MDFRLTDEQRAWQLKARKFADEEIKKISVDRDAIADPRETIDWEIIRKGSQLGFRTLGVPNEWGGPGVDFTTQALVMAELARGDSSIAKTFSQCWKWCHLIMDRATPAQQERWLKPFMADDGFLLGGGITEPNAGSDNRLPPAAAPKSGLRLSARRDGDAWLLNGEKCFIANANIGKLIFVFTRTNPDAAVRAGTTIFAMPMPAAGVRVGKVFNKSGWRFYQNAELIFEDARVPQADMLGALNGAMKHHGGKNAKFAELEYSANAVGVCDAAVEMAMKHARREKHGGRPLADQQMVQLQLSEMHMMTEALRSFALRVATEADDEEAEHFAHSHFLMNFATEAIQRVCNLNQEIHGYADGMASAGADKLVRDAIIWTHIAGDAVQRMKAMSFLLK
jgi:alkylation response protein AidB-like acyl-CoA dehydrogenase